MEGTHAGSGNGYETNKPLVVVTDVKQTVSRKGGAVPGGA